jgi:hypothetical protein
MSNIRIVHKKPGMVNLPDVREVANNIDAKQALVSPRGVADCRIERLFAPEFECHGIEVFGNEEYMFDRDCTPNIEVGGQMIRGPIYFTSYNEDGEAVSLTDVQVTLIVLKLRTVVQSIF